ncbi:MAG: CDP-alcohol phosphatidyltransferase family protein [Bacteroidota bacterium]
MTPTDTQQPSTPELGRFWTASNVMSLARLGMAWFAAYLVYTEPTPNPAVIGLIFLCILSDWLDGKIARWSKTVSDWGKVLDPTCDKLGGGMVLIAMTAAGLLPLWLVILFVVRDLIIVIAWQYMVRRTSHVYMSLMPGKITVGVLALLAFLVLFGIGEPWTTYLIWASAGMMVYSLAHYIVLLVLELRKLAGRSDGTTVAQRQRK